MLESGSELNVLIRQLTNFWEISNKEKHVLKTNIVRAKKKFFLNMKDITAKGCENLSASHPVNPLHTVQWSIFLYVFSRELYLNDHYELAEKVFYLNKIMHSVDWFYEIELPVHFFAVHPLGSVLGRGIYGDFFMIYQGCTVGSNGRGGEQPQIGQHVLMFSNSKILGASNIGNRVIVSANSYIKDQNVPDDVIVFGQSPNLHFKPLGEKKHLLNIWKSFDI